MLALVATVGVFASGFATTTNVVSAAPAAIFSEDFNSITQTNTGSQAHTGLTVGAWDSLTGWSSAGTHAIHDVDRILGAGKDIAVSFYNNNEITLTTGFAANTSGVVYTMTFDVGPSVWAGASQASNSTDGLIVALLRANGTTVASTTQLSGAWNGTATAQDAMTSRTFVYTGDGTGVVRIKVSNINPSADRFGGAIDNIVVTQGAPACTPVTSTSGSDTVVSFKTVGLCAWTVPSTISSVQYLVVAGGGGGGSNAGGGGGAGASNSAGGGGGYRQGGGRAGDGGSGIVVVRYSIPAPPSNLSLPIIIGTARTGETLTASSPSSSWTGSPTSYSYQWKRASAPSGSYSNISSLATSNSYELTDADVGKYIKVSVVATNSIGSSVAELSAATSQTPIMKEAAINQ